MSFPTLPPFPPPSSQLMHSHQCKAWRRLEVVPSFSMGQTTAALSTESWPSRSHPTSTPVAYPRHAGQGEVEAHRLQKTKSQAKSLATPTVLGSARGLFNKYMFAIKGTRQARAPPYSVLAPSCLWGLGQLLLLYFLPPSPLF